MISAKRLWILSVIVAVAGLTPASLCAQQYVYTNNNDPIANTTTAFNVSPTGEITILNTYQTGGLGFATSYPGLASVVTAAPGMTTCLYVSDAGSGDVAAFGIDRLNGTLTTVANSPFSTGGTGTLNGIGLAVGYSSPTTLLFAANSASSTVTAFIVHGDCRLTIHKASTVPYAVAGMEVTSSGQYLIVGYQNGMVDSLQIAYPGGALTELGPFTAQGAAAGVDISCDSSTAYFGDSTSTGMEVEPFSIGSTGLLAPLATFTNSSGNNSSNVLLSTDGNTLFVDNNTSLQITTLAVGTGGALTYEATIALNNPNVDQSSSTTLITNKGGGRVFVAEQGITGEPGALGLLKVKAGALKEVNGSPVATGDPNSPAISITTYPGKVCQ